MGNLCKLYNRRHRYELLWGKLTLLSAEAGAGDNQHLGVVQQAVEAGAGQQRVEEQFGPFVGARLEVSKMLPRS